MDRCIAVGNMCSAPYCTSCCCGKLRFLDFQAISLNFKLVEVSPCSARRTQPFARSAISEWSRLPLKYAILRGERTYYMHVFHQRYDCPNFHLFSCASITLTASEVRSSAFHQMKSLSRSSRRQRRYIRSTATSITPNGIVTPLTTRLIAVFSR